MPAQWNLWYEDVALPPCSDPGKPYSLELSWQNRYSNKRIRRSSDHRREPPQTAAAETVTPSGGLEVQCLAHSVLRFSDHGMRPEHHAHILEGLRKAGWQ